ncbi:MAG: hypothetical protein ACP5M9_03890 [Candidatus Micrarchaeia archaeon]
MNFEKLSLNDLIKRFYDSIKSFARSMEKVTEINKTVNYGEIKELKEHITKRLDSGENLEDNKKLISALDLLSKDQSILNIIKDDAEDWIDMLEAIERSIAEPGKKLDKKEMSEVKKIEELSGSIKKFLRKD